MTTTINASPTNGLVQTADGSGILKVQSNGVATNALAWVNFNGTGTVAIRSSYNVSSITDNGVGDYTVNFTNAMADTNYAVVGGSGNGTTFTFITPNAGTKTTTTTGIYATTGGTIALGDPQTVCIAVFGN